MFLTFYPPLFTLKNELNNLIILAITISLLMFRVFPKTCSLNLPSPSKCPQTAYWTLRARENFQLLLRVSLFAHLCKDAWFGIFGGLMEGWELRPRPLSLAGQETWVKCPKSFQQWTTSYSKKRTPRSVRTQKVLLLFLFREKAAQGLGGEKLVHFLCRPRALRASSSL